MMSKGKVKTYDSNRGYGGILDFETGLLLTVYANYVLLAKGEFLQEGQDVEYQIENKRNENWAINVKVV